MTEVNYSGRQLQLDDQTVELPDPAKEHLEIDILIVVRMDTLAKSGYPQNVWAFDQDGELRWKIDAADPSSGKSEPYTSISTRDGRLWAYNWDGYTYEIDLETGAIVGKEYVK